MLLDPTQQAYLFDVETYHRLADLTFHDEQVIAYRKQKRRSDFALNFMLGSMVFLVFCILAMIGVAVYAATLP